MSSLEDIADAKVQAAVARRLDALTPAIVSIRQEMNGRGLLHPPSSITATKIRDACILLFDEIRDHMKTGYGMVLDNAFWPTESLGDLLFYFHLKNELIRRSGSARQQYPAGGTRPTKKHV